MIPDAEHKPPALFLLDIMVPGGDGLDLCRRLRQNPTLSIVPIIFLTARAAENDRVHGLIPNKKNTFQLKYVSVDPGENGERSKSTTQATTQEF